MKQEKKNPNHGFQRETTYVTEAARSGPRGLGKRRLQGGRGVRKKRGALVISAFHVEGEAKRKEVPKKR